MLALSSLAAITKPGQKAFESLFLTLQKDRLANLVTNLANQNPEQSRAFLQLVHQESGPKIFAHYIRLMTKEPVFIKRFLDAAVGSLNAQSFSKIMDGMLQEPRVIKIITKESILRLDDDNLIKILETATKYPKALKTFNMAVSDKVLADFTKQTYQDLEALALIIQSIKDQHGSIEGLAPGVDINDISKKIVSQLDKEYFLELVLPKNRDPELIFQSLSLTDGLIDMPGEEVIDLEGVGRQSLKMIDSPWFVMSFVWNIYFGDHSSSLALAYRKTVIDADEKDGVKDRKIVLRDLAKKSPETFQKIQTDLAALLNVAKFREKMSEPDILLDPLMDFINAHDAKTAARVLSPLLARSVDIKPALCKIVIRELPPQIVADILKHVVGYMAGNPAGRKTLRKLSLSLWENINEEELQHVVKTINKTEPQALFEINTGAIRALTPEGLKTVTLAFLEFEEPFYRFNQIALENLTDDAIKTIAAGVTADPVALYRHAMDVSTNLPATEVEEFLQHLSHNAKTLTIIDQLLGALQKPFLDDLRAQFLKQQQPTLQAMRVGFPKNLVEQVLASAAKHP